MSVRQKMIRVISGLSGFGVFLVFALLASLLVITVPEAEQSEVTEKAWPVSVMKVKPEQLSLVSMTYGRLETRQVAALKTSLSATVARAGKQDAAWLKKGEWILALEREEAGNALGLVEAGLKRSQSLLGSGKSEHAPRQQQTVRQETLAELAEK